MAQMPIQLVAGRAQSYVPPASIAPSGAPPSPPAAAAPRPLPAAPKSSQAFDPGAISGGQLRPGSIDQVTFRERMAALNRADVAPGSTPRAMPGAAAQLPAQSPIAMPPAVRSAPAIPSLTPAQLAALGVDVSGLEPAAPPAELAAQTSPVETAPAADPAAQTAGAQTTGAPTLATATPPAATEPEATAEQQASAAPAEAETAEAETDAAARANAPMPGAHLGKDGIWELPRQPGKDEREWLAGMNAKWRLVENPDSVRLFLGEDGKFGFDDFLDIINPLQHIPLLNIAYRKLTGDEIDGAAQLLGAIPFGPISVASNITDIAFRSETGAGMAENGLAMLFGGGDEAADVDQIATASGNATQLADASQIRRGSNR